MTTDTVAATGSVTTTEPQPPTQHPRIVIGAPPSC